MEIEKLIEALGDLEMCAYGYHINGEVLGMDCTDFECLMADAAEEISKIPALQAELERVKQLYESEKEDFIDYACSGVPNLSPYCTNRHPDCVDERGWCRTEKCHGFSRNRDQKEDI